MVTLWTHTASLPSSLCVLQVQLIFMHPNSTPGLKKRKKKKTEGYNGHLSLNLNDLGVPSFKHHNRKIKMPFNWIKLMHLKRHLIQYKYTVEILYSLCKIWGPQHLSQV